MPRLARDPSASGAAGVAARRRPRRRYAAGV